MPSYFWPREGWTQMKDNSVETMRLCFTTILSKRIINQSILFHACVRYKEIMKVLSSENNKNKLSIYHLRKYSNELLKLHDVWTN